MENNYKIYSIFNPRDKLSERKEELIRERDRKEELIREREEELIREREMIKNECKEMYREKTKEITREMQIYQTKKWKHKNTVALSGQYKRRYLWLKESNRLRNILLV